VEKQRSIWAYFRSVSLASCVMTRSPVPKAKRTLSEAPLMSCEIRTSEPGSPMPTRRGSTVGRHCHAPVGEYISKGRQSLFVCQSSGLAFRLVAVAM